jgi:hypothetical protein
MWGEAKGEKFSGLHSCWAEFAAARCSLRTLAVQLKAICIYGFCMLVNFNLDITLRKVIFLRIFQTVFVPTQTPVQWRAWSISLD